MVSTLYSDTYLMTLSEVLNPKYFIVKMDTIYVFEDYKIHIYDKNSLKYKGGFGKKGKGPKEFDDYMMPSIFEDRIIVNSRCKYLVYSSKGEFKNEVKVEYADFVTIPLTGGNFFKWKLYADFNIRKRIRSFILVDNKNTLIKTFFKSEDSMMSKMNTAIKPLNVQIYYTIDERHIIIPDPREKFLISIYDFNGKLVNLIDLKYKKVKVSEKYKDRIRKRFFQGSKFSSPLIKMYMKRRKFEFPEYFPPFQSVDSDSTYLYVYRPCNEYDKTDLWILTKKGKVIYQEKLPLKNSAFYDGICYSLIENEDDEEWELYSRQLFKIKRQVKPAEYR